ncbi:MAG: hypothetical protein ACP5N7_05875 [Candidatus Pacearchaeota archaeon]
MKNILFQYATLNKVIEDTNLITLEEANLLWNKYLPDIKERWNKFESPQMCIWKNCNSNTDYSEIEKEIDFRDCELSGDSFYKIVRTIIN